MPSHTPRQIIAGTDVLESFKTIDQRMWIPEEIVSRIHTAMTAAGWESMDSAPDETTILVKTTNCGEQLIAQQRVRTMMGGGPIEKYWVAFVGGQAISIREPTHWRYLPPPPKAIEP